jgi:hypothetical protein
MSNIPQSKLDALKERMDAEHADAQELYHWSMAMLAVEQGKARIMEQHTLDERLMVTFASPEGDVVTAPKPQVSDDLLALMLETVREIAAEEARYLK